jgi:hexosaminidase
LIYCFFDKKINQKYRSYTSNNKRHSGHDSAVSQNKKEDSVTIGGYTTIQKVYSYEPLPKEMDPADHKYVLGAQANVWTEYMNNTAKAEYMVFPRISALSEVLWTNKENKSWPSFEKKLLHEFKRYDNFKINYSKAYFNPENN